MSDKTGVQPGSSFTEHHEGNHAANQAESQDTILQALAGEVKPVRKPFFYFLHVSSNYGLSPLAVGASH